MRQLKPHVPGCTVRVLRLSLKQVRSLATRKSTAAAVGDPTAVEELSRQAIQLQSMLGQFKIGPQRGQQLCVAEDCPEVLGWGGVAQAAVAVCVV